MDINAKLKQYAENKAEIKRLETENKNIGPDIVGYLNESKIDKQPTSLGDFVLYRTKSWTYSGAVGELESKLEETKIKEEQDGTATFVEKPVLKFIEKKQNNE